MRFLQAGGRQAAGIDDRHWIEPALAHVPDVHQRSLRGLSIPPASLRCDPDPRLANLFRRPYESGSEHCDGQRAVRKLAPRRRAIFVATRLAGDTPLDAWITGLQAHLAPFPGTVDVSQYADGWEKWLSLEWLIGRNRNVDLTLVTFTASRKAVSRLEWHQIARQTVLSRLRPAA
ncbi:MAG: hypothetical protein U0992_16055 [Planctomycetaceae bacterium]